MRKKSLLVLLVLVSAIIFQYFLVAVENQTIIYVPDDYRTIQDAVNAASARDTIIVRSGTHAEHVVVYKALTIISEKGPANCIIQPDQGVNAFDVTADNVCIDGFTILGSGSVNTKGISIGAQKNVTLENNNITGFEHGVLIGGGASNIRIVNNVISGNSVWGIIMGEVNNNLIAHNTILLNGGQGIIALGAGGNNKILNNEVSYNGFNGIQLEGSSNNTVTDNICTSNGRLQLGEGIYLVDSQKNLIANNFISNNSEHGIEIWIGASNNVVANNNVTSNYSHGIIVWRPGNNTITNNLVSCNGKLHPFHGLHYYTGIILLDGTKNNVVSSNTIASNHNDGIYVEASSNNIIVNNTITDNKGNGIRVYLSRGNTIANNFMSNNEDLGILLHNASINNIVMKNTALITGGNSINIVVLSNNNIIYLNNFKNGASESPTNTWNLPSKILYSYGGKNYTNYLGNYWSDYNGSDVDGDGIGDTPYNKGGVKDSYPLIAKFELFNLTVAPVAPPTAVTASASNIAETSLKLIWDKSTVKNFARYEVFQSTTKSLLGTSIANITDSATTSLTVSILSPGTKYYFTVRIVDLEGLYADSTQVEATTLLPIWQQQWFIATTAGVIIIIAVAVMLFRRKPAEHSALFDFRN